MRKKCAIYDSINTNKTDIMLKRKEKLIKFCKEELNIDDIEIFQDIKTSKKPYENFQDMIDRINKGEFTDLLVHHPKVMYRREYKEEGYNKENFYKIIKKLKECNIEMHSMIDDENCNFKYLTTHRPVRMLLDEYYGEGTMSFPE